MYHASLDRAEAISVNLFRHEPNVMRATLTAVSLLGALCSGTTVSAAEPEWPTVSYDYVVVDQDLRIVLEQFGVNTGLRIALSDAVQGRVHGRLPPALPRQFLDHLTATFGLDWYYDGVAILVSAKSEAQTEMINLKGTDFSELRSALETAGFLDRRYQLRAGRENSSAIVSGPPRYVAVVKQVAASFSPTPGTVHVTVFRGSSISRVEFP
ncbi:nodulation protein NolW [Bradyrhizobium sp. STM 3557]|uniref:nodulation protein NolW n=1 Tax=Bradyrhizobium sp. STM 3557 TaxID=578920 RepID=UPI0038902DEA